MDEASMRILIPLACAAGGWVIAATFFLGRRSDLLNVLPRLQKTVEGDPEEQNDTAKRHGLVGQIRTLQGQQDRNQKITLDNEMFRKAWMRENGIPTGSGELELSRQIGEAMRRQRRSDSDVEASQNRRAMIAGLDDLLEHDAPRPPMRTDKHGTPTPPAPRAPPRPAPRPRDTETPPPHPTVLPKGGRLLTPPPFDPRHSSTGKAFPPRDDED